MREKNKSGDLESCLLVLRIKIPFGIHLEIHLEITIANIVNNINIEGRNQRLNRYVFIKLLE